MHRLPLAALAAGLLLTAGTALAATDTSPVAATQATGAGPAGATGTHGAAPAASSPSGTSSASSGTTAGTGGAPAASLSKADKSFAMAAAQGGLAEVQDGQLATQKGTARVKQLGQKLVTDHSQANDELQQIATQDNLTLPTQPSATQMATHRRLSSLNGSAFDTSFAHDEVVDHQQTIALFRKEAQSGHDPALKQFAQKTLPVLRQHLEMAQQISQH
jgi:putative membrane protein